MDKTWIINLRSSDMTNNNNVFSTLLNIPEMSGFKNFKVYVKDFIVCRCSFAGNDNVYQLNSNLMFSNSYDSKYGSATKTLCVVPYSISHFTSKGGNPFETTQNINGKLQLWIEDINGNVIPQQAIQVGANTNSYASFIVSIVVIGFN